MKTIEPKNSLNKNLLTKTMCEHLPAQNTGDGGIHYFNLLEDLREFSIKTTDQLTRLIEKHRALITRSEREMVVHRKIVSGPGCPVAMETPENKKRLARGVYFTHVAFVRMALAAEFGDRWERYIRSREFCERERVYDD